MKFRKPAIIAKQKENLLRFAKIVLLLHLCSRQVPGWKNGSLYRYNAASAVKVVANDRQLSALVADKLLGVKRSEKTSVHHVNPLLCNRGQTSQPFLSHNDFLSFSQTPNPSTSGKFLFGGRYRTRLHFPLCGKIRMRPVFELVAGNVHRTFPFKWVRVLYLKCHSK